MEKITKIAVQKNETNKFKKLNEFISEHWSDGVFISDNFCYCLFFSKDFRNENNMRVTTFINRGYALELFGHRTFSGNNAINDAITNHNEILNVAAKSGEITVKYVDDIGDWGEINVY